MAASAEAICSMALSHLGELGNNISSITSPTNASEIHCSRFYAIARDKAIADMEPQFSVRKVALTLYDEDFANSVLNDEWGYAYPVPSDMIKLLKILPEGAQHNLPSEDFELFTFRHETATPESTDTDAETVTFEDAPRWVSGVAVSPATTGGGLTAGTTYYVGKVSTTEFSFHATLAAALAGTSPVNLSGSITSAIVPSADVNVILTDVVDAYADYLARLTITTTFPEEVTLAISYLLASYLALPIVKGKSGLALQGQMVAMYNLVKAGALKNDQNQKKIAERYRTRKPGFVEATPLSDSNILTPWARR